MPIIYRHYGRFLLTRPSRGATRALSVHCVGFTISTHTPLAGRDAHSLPGLPLRSISTHTPLAGRDIDHYQGTHTDNISTHTPLAGRDCRAEEHAAGLPISTHTPLAGRDQAPPLRLRLPLHFYSHAPRGARPFPILP